MDAQQRRELYFACKRLLDVVVAISGLVILAPLILLIVVLIKVDSPGPAIFRQERVGAKRRRGDGREWWETMTFAFYKFRSMCNDSEPELHRAFVRAFIRADDDGMAALQRVCRGETVEPAAHRGNDERGTRKLLHDPRVTSVGKFLRKSSLDELPQLWNVVKGDMSLVGPRPPIPYEVEEYRPWHRRRLRAKPGLTGLWQVTARSSASFDEKVRLDVEYIENQSLWLDLKILAKTPLVVLSGDGAM